MGMVVAISLLAISNFIPFTKISFGVMSLVPEETGTRLYFGGFHFHHSYIGAVLLLLSIPIFFKYPEVSLLLVGVGVALIADQIPFLFLGKPWGESIVQSIVR